MKNKTDGFNKLFAIIFLSTLAFAIGVTLKLKESWQCVEWENETKTIYPSWAKFLCGEMKDGTLVKGEIIQIDSYEMENNASLVEELLNNCSMIGWHSSSFSYSRTISTEQQICTKEGKNCEEEKIYVIYTNLKNWEAGSCGERIVCDQGYEGCLNFLSEYWEYCKIKNLTKETKLICKEHRDIK